jgi:hypothetical protein
MLLLSAGGNHNAIKNKLRAVMSLKTNAIGKLKNCLHKNLSLCPTTKATAMKIN